MAVIDADTHVDESESTWQSLQGRLARHAPMTMAPPPEEIEHTGFDPHRSRFWLVEGRLQNRVVRDDAHHPARARRELEDIEGRLEDMDRMGVDVQVIFPTFFIRYIALNPEPEAALAHAYNSFVAEKCDRTGGRLRWAAVLPWLDADAAIEELRWAKANGACGIFKRGLDLLKPVGDPHFLPVYEAANDLDVPLCVHTGQSGQRRRPRLRHHGRLLLGRAVEAPRQVPQPALRVHRGRSVVDPLRAVADRDERALRRPARPGRQARIVTGTCSGRTACTSPSTRWTTSSTCSRSGPRTTS